MWNEPDAFRPNNQSLLTKPCEGATFFKLCDAVFAVPVLERVELFELDPGELHALLLSQLLLALLALHHVFELLARHAFVQRVNVIRARLGLVLHRLLSFAFHQDVGEQHGRVHRLDLVVFEVDQAVRAVEHLALGLLADLALALVKHLLRRLDLIQPLLPVHLLLLPLRLQGVGPVLVALQRPLLERRSSQRLVLVRLPGNVVAHCSQLAQLAGVNHHALAGLPAFGGVTADEVETQKRDEVAEWKRRD